MSLYVDIHEVDRLIRDMRARLGFRAHNLLAREEAGSGDADGTRGDGAGLTHSLSDVH